MVTSSNTAMSSGYADAEELVAYLREVLGGISALPSVTVAGITNFNPMRSHGWGAAVWLKFTRRFSPASTAM